ncbi:MAG: ADP-ribosylation factor-like protein [Candidatus Hodarchaeales archaeon]|jgi:GTPase SAR1 family protein
MISDFLRLLKGFILFIGPSEAGKTSILRRLVNGTFEEQEPTLGFLEEFIANVKIIEIGGQETYRSYWQTALEQEPVHVFFIIDVTKKTDFEEYIDLIKRSKTQYPHLYTKITLIGNKIDLLTNLPSYITDLESSILCSAKEGEGMLDILEEIANLKSNAESTLPPIKKTETDEKSSPNEKQKVEELLKSFQGKLDQS